MTRRAYRAAIGRAPGGCKRAACGRPGPLPEERGAERSRADSGAMEKAAAVVLVTLVALLGLAQADREYWGRAGARGAEPSFGVSPRVGLPPLSTPPSPQ